MAFDLNLQFFIPAEPPRVMALLTDAKLLRAWSGEEGSVDKKPGGKVEMFDGLVTGEVLKATENELAYTWKQTGWAEDTKPAEVHYTLSKNKEGTKIVLVHKNLPSQEEMDNQKEEWEENFFGLMEEYVWATTR